MTNDEIIGLLRHDMEMEHQAILQYLITGWTIESMEAAIVEISRDEMRHFKWFGLAIRQLGGEPSMAVPDVKQLGDPVEMLRHNVEMERTVAETYEQRLEQIHDDSIRQLYLRLRGDELYHMAEFEKLVAKAERLSENGELKVAQLDKSPDKHKRLLWRYLQEDVSGEYAAILRYLHQSFVVEDGRLAGSLEDRAIDEMKHMGWLAEEAVESGGQPDLAPEPVTYTEDMREIFTGNTKLEREAEARYERHMAGYDDEDMRKLWRFIQFQEEHHSAEFEDRLQKLSDGEQSQPGEEPPAEEPPAESSESNDVESSPSEEAPDDTKPSVGALYRKNQ